MIVPMVKYSMLIYHKDYEEILNNLYELGVVHIIKKNVGVPDENVQAALRDIDSFRSEIRFLMPLVGKEVPAESEGSVNGRFLVDKLAEIREHKSYLIQQGVSVQNEINRMCVWGRFDFGLFDKFRGDGYDVNFYVCSGKDFDVKWEDEYNAIVINEKAGNIFFITITNEGVLPEVQAERFKLADLSLSELESKSKEIEIELESVNIKLHDFAVQHLNDFRQAVIRVGEKLDFANVRLSTEKVADDKLMMVEGWVPKEKCDAVNLMLDELKVYYVIEEPKEGDNVPVSLKNNKFSKMFEVIGNLYDLPTYGTMDLTPYFAPFYVLFFGFCFADAGYGLLMLIASLTVKFLSKNESLKSYMNLVFILSLGTIFWGLLTGNFFGIELAKLDWVQAREIRNYILDSNKLFTLALVLGVIQVLYGMVLKAIFKTRKLGFKHAAASWGWAILLIGLSVWYLLSDMEVLVKPVSDYVLYGVVGVGALGILFFSEPDKPFYLNPFYGLKAVYEMATSLLGDVLSYIRLFALNISGAVMAIVFNQLATEMSGDIPVLSVIFMIIMLLIGHAMNIFMSGLSSFIHPMRLTFVEFYKNAGFEGGGKPYKPFGNKS